MFIQQLISSIFVLKADSGEITSSCSAAKIQFEDRCPLTKVEWIQQSKLKQCSNIVLPCQEQQFLEYHCLPNTWQNQTISVCALPKIINGKTLHYMLKAIFVKGNIRIHLKYPRRVKLRANSIVLCTGQHDCFLLYEANQSICVITLQ